MIIKVKNCVLKFTKYTNLITDASLFNSATNSGNIATVDATSNVVTMSTSSVVGRIRTKSYIEIPSNAKEIAYRITGKNTTKGITMVILDSDDKLVLSIGNKNITDTGVISSATNGDNNEPYEGTIDLSNYPSAKKIWVNFYYGDKEETPSTLQEAYEYIFTTKGEYIKYC